MATVKSLTHSAVFIKCSMWHRELCFLAILKNESRGLPEFTSPTAGVRERIKHFQAFACFLNILTWDRWGGNVPFCKNGHRGKVSKRKSPLCSYHSHRHKVSNLFKMWMNRLLTTYKSLGDRSRDGCEGSVASCSSHLGTHCRPPFP